jgi:hypothetical protein
MAPFKTRWEFWTWLPGVVVTVCCLGILAGLRRRRLLPPIGVVAIAVLSYLLAALAIAFLDRHTQYLGKFYLFRPSSMALFLSITAMVMAVRSQCAESARYALTLIATAFIIVFSWNTIKAQVDIVRRAPSIPHERELVAAIESHSTAGDIVLLEPVNEMRPEFGRLHRVIPRPTLVSWKFAPTYPDDLMRWYDLVQRRERFFAEGCAAPMQPPVKLLVIFNKQIADKMRACGDVVWEEPDALLMRLR